MPKTSAPKSPIKRRRSERIRVTRATTSKKQTRKSGQKRRTKAPVAPKERDDSTDEDSDSEDTMDTEPDPTSAKIDPVDISEPVTALVHKNLRNAWQINKNLPICFIFDSISPARRFKRGMPHNENIDFPVYNDKESGNVTETDDVACPGWMQYMQDDYL